MGNKGLIKFNKLKECRWAIHNYSVEDLKEVLDELKKTKEIMAL